MASIESKNIDISAWWWASEVTDYSKILGEKQPEIGQDQTENERKQAEDILKQIQWTEKIEEQKNNQTIEHESSHTTPRIDGQQRKKDNPGEANEKRVDAGNSLVEEIKKPQNNFIAKWAQRVLEKLNIS